MLYSNERKSSKEESNFNGNQGLLQRLAYNEGMNTTISIYWYTDNQPIQS